MKRWNVLLLLIVLVLALNGCDTKPETLEDHLKMYENMINNASCAKFEYIDDLSRKHNDIRGEYDELKSFASLLQLCEFSDLEYTGEWIYRLTFDPQEYIDNDNELVILIGTQCLSVDGVVFVHKNADQSEILELAEAKYKHIFGYNPDTKSTEIS